jgi:hypothetical protein
MQTVENRAETNDVLSTDLWIERSTGKFLMIERKDSQLTSMSACDGSVFKAYEVAGHRAGEFTVDKMMSVAPDAITARRGVLESVKEYADALVERSDSPGSPIDVSGRSGLLFKAISRSIDGSRIAQADSLDLIVDKNTGLPLQETVRDPNGDTVSTKNYDYEVTSGPEGGFTVAIPADYYIERDGDLPSPTDESLSAEELAQTAGHAVYWVGDTLEGRPVSFCNVGGTGVVQLTYGESESSSVDIGSPKISLYEYVPSELDPEILQSITAALTNPKEVKGAGGIYVLYEASINGMPMLEVVRGDVHVLIADVDDGDIPLMIRVADSLIEVSP